MRDARNLTAFHHLTRSTNHDGVATILKEFDPRELDAVTKPFPLVRYAYDQGEYHNAALLILRGVCVCKATKEGTYIGKQAIQKRRGEDIEFLIERQVVITETFVHNGRNGRELPYGNLLSFAIARKDFSTTITLLHSNLFDLDHKLDKRGTTIRQAYRAILENWGVLEVEPRYTRSGARFG